MIASWISRVRFDVMTTTGGVAARIGPSSGIVTWYSASTSSRYASNGSSVRSSSSISSTGAMPSSGASASQQRPLQQEPRREDVVRERVAIDVARGLGEPDLDHLPRVVPLVDRRRDVEAFVALQAHELLAERRGQHLGDLGLADARLAFEEQRAAHLEREKDAGREAAVGDVVVAVEQREDGVDGGGIGNAHYGAVALKDRETARIPILVAGHWKTGQQRRCLRACAASRPGSSGSAG